MEAGKRKTYSFLISETYSGLGAVSDIREDSITDKVTGNKILVTKWTNALSNTSKKTGNGNLFTYEDISEGIANDYVQVRIKRKAFFNEFEHPTRDNPERYLMVYDSKVSDRINKFWFEDVNGDKILMGECETATYAYGPEMRKKILSGAIPAKSLRASGNVMVEADGTEKKNLMIVSYDNVFCPSDSYAWGNPDTINSKESYMESLANTAAMKAYKNPGVALKEIMGNFKPIDKDITFFSESFQGFKPEKVMMMDSQNGIIGFYTESVIIKTKVEDKLLKGLNEFFKI